MEGDKKRNTYLRSISVLCRGQLNQQKKNATLIIADIFDTFKFCYLLVKYYSLKFLLADQLVRTLFFFFFFKKIFFLKKFLQGVEILLE